MSGSEKTAVIEHLFEQCWDSEGNFLAKPIVSLSDVSQAIQACNQRDGLKRSSKNPANFVKDIVRSRNASRIWPARLRELGIGAVQRTGSGDSFEFVLLPEGQTDPFPDLYRAEPSTRRFRHQSVSMPLASKALGRTDEPWLIQTAVNLKLIEQHLAANSDHDVVEVTHLQMSVKLRATEIDAIYSARVRVGDEALKAIITCEAKKHSERILVDQISSQVKAAFETMQPDMVIPLAIRSVRNEGIQLIEFAAVTRAESENFREVSYCDDIVYQLVPPVKGI